jgi:hypothetical protein
VIKKTMDRMSLDLGIARTDVSIPMKRWRYLFVGNCTGIVTFKLGSKSGSPLNPTEFDKLTNIEEYKFMYITNTAQSGEELNLYFEEEKVDETEILG